MKTDSMRDAHMALYDGYWVVLCDQIKKSKSVDDIRYYATMDSSEGVYKHLQIDKVMRQKLISKCYDLKSAADHID